MKTLLFNRILSIVLIAIMLTSILPLHIFAQGKEDNSDITRYTVLILDIEKEFTMNNYSGQQIYEVSTPIESIKTASTRFVEQIQNAQGTNYVSIVTYDSDVHVISDFTTDTETLKSDIGKLEVGNRWANIEAAISKADSMLDNVNNSAVKNVVLFTQGLASNGKYNNIGKYSIDDCNWYRNDNNIYLYQYSNSAYETAQSAMQEYNLYSIGLFQSFDDVPAEGVSLLDFAKRFTEDIQNAGYYEVTNPSDLEFQFGEIANDITNINGIPFKFGGMINVDEKGKHVDHESICYYTDSYFFTDPKNYNNSLATMSLCLELSAYTSHNTLNDKTWDAVTATQNAENLLTGKIGGRVTGDRNLEFTDFFRSEDTYDKPTKDSIGAIAAQKKISDGDNEYTLVALAVRGGGYGSEWASNFTIGESGSHQGFSEARDKVINFLYDYVETTGINGSIKLWIVGYSRGGITANMVAGKLCEEQILPSQVTFDPNENLYCYTFETPQGIIENNNINPAYLNIHNTINLNDIVPLVAPEVWNFSRYNRKYDYVIPTAQTHEEIDFENKIKDMKYQLSLLIDETISKDFEYKVNEYNQYVSDFSINWTKILPGGQPFIELVWSDDKSAPTSFLLRNTIDWLFNDIIKDRTYYMSIQEAVRVGTDIMFDYYGLGQGILDEINNILLAPNDIMYIISPIFSINPFLTYDTRLNKVIERFDEKFDEFIESISGIYEFQLQKIMPAIKPIILRVITSLADDLWNNEDYHFFTVVNTAEYIAFTGGQWHYPEVCLAWLRSVDPNYNNISQTNHTINSTISRVIHINCPVDVYVYNANENLVASIIENVPAQNLSTIVSVVNNNGEKVIYLPGNGEYEIDIIATDDGYVSYAVNEYNFVYGTETRLLNYYNIPVAAGDVLKGLVPKISGDELQDNAPDGSTADYQLLDKNAEVLPVDSEYTGKQIDNRYFDVTLQKEGNSGYITGAGTFLEGHFAQVTAQALPSAEFYGWYEGDTLVSDEMTYRFAVTKDITLTAKFNDVEFHEMKLAASEGGKITSVEGYYSEGIQIAVVAEPDEGYVFDYWTTSDGGTFEDINEAYTFYTMPNNEVTVTAHFKVGTSSDEPDEPNEPEQPKNTIIFPKLFNVTVKTSEGGSTNVSEEFVIAYGASRTIKITPDEGYTVKDVTVNGKSVGAVTVYEIKGACEAYEVKITFEKID